MRSTLFRMRIFLAAAELLFGGPRPALVVRYAYAEVPGRVRCRRSRLL